MFDKEEDNIRQIEILLQQVGVGFKDKLAKLEIEKEKFAKVKNVVDLSLITDPIKLEVGGKIFKTSKETLTKIKGSYFDVMLSGQCQIDPFKLFIDRDGKHFRHILNYLRTMDYSVIPKQFREEIDRELEFYNLRSLSTLIDHQKFQIIKDWIGIPEKKFELIHRGTRDGFSSRAFHDACNGKGETVTLVKSSDGNVFGGYNSQSWNSDNNTRDVDSKFIALSSSPRAHMYPHPSSIR
ncbi:hypothetical protein DFA_06910 [Cavenderia fasciculata]|uniref:BTB domain-containing protein n=1 Tax=Cavenderia fasciculata TaxID=261658 RepID=F4PX05_CACFS|nr:uncharacterized protein DFA_06910 [Cavenderia fasciculata]EGG19808.1 hypothetical protein DFA_06910 [Cavenderia fasciculata]|eukprot:XP_004358154.1 hypothetical protein DFA_06910 [Cavenderia fasciculata]